MANYGRENENGVDLSRKENVKKAMELAEGMRNVQEEAGAALMRAQEEMKRQVDKGRKKTEAWKVA